MSRNLCISIRWASRSYFISILAACLLNFSVSQLAQADGRDFIGGFTAGVAAGVIQNEMNKARGGNRTVFARRIPQPLLREVMRRQIARLIKKRIRAKARRLRQMQLRLQNNKKMRRTILARGRFFLPVLRSFLPHSRPSRT